MVFQRGLSPAEVRPWADSSLCGVLGELQVSLPPSGTVELGYKELYLFLLVRHDTWDTVGCMVVILASFMLPSCDHPKKKIIPSHFH